MLLHGSLLYLTISAFPAQHEPMRVSSLHIPTIRAFFFCFEEEALHVSQTCQVQQYEQTAKGNLWGWGIHSTTHNRESCFAMASDECLT